MYPEDRRYTEQHEWAKPEETLVRVGLTEFAQESLGDIVYVSLPVDGAEVRAGEPMGEVESTKSVADLYAPVSGTVVTTNATLDGQPELINTDPYGAGWIVQIEPADPAEVGGLLDAAGYERHVAAS